MTTVPRRTRRTSTVPLADVRKLLDAVEAVLGLPKDGVPDALRYRLAHTSGVLSTVEDERSMTFATDMLRRVVECATEVPGE